MSTTLKPTNKPAGPLARRRQRASAVNPAWARAEAAGRAARGSLLSKHANPYAYGSQCWLVFEQARQK